MFCPFNQPAVASAAAAGSLQIESLEPYVPLSVYPMFSQSLLLAAWREPAALPFSSASSHAETTLGSSPVSAASLEANCCWPVVIFPLAVAGSEALVPVTPADVPTPWACWSVDANVCPVEPVPAVLCVAAAAVDGSKAVPRDASCP